MFNFFIRDLPSNCIKISSKLGHFMILEFVVRVLGVFDLLCNELKMTT